MEASVGATGLGPRPPLPPQMGALLRLASLRADPLGDDPGLLLALEAYFGEHLLSGALRLLDGHAATPRAASDAAGSPERGEGEAANERNAEDREAPVARFVLQGHSGASFLSVRGNRGLSYSVLDGGSFCSCGTCHRGLVGIGADHSEEREEPPSIVCKHVLAAALAEATGRTVTKVLESKVKFAEKMVTGTAGKHL